MARKKNVVEEVKHINQIAEESKITHVDETGKVLWSEVKTHGPVVDTRPSDNVVVHRGPDLIKPDGFSPLKADLAGFIGSPESFINNNAPIEDPGLLSIQPGFFDKMFIPNPDQRDMTNTEHRRRLKDIEAKIDNLRVDIDNLKGDVLKTLDHDRCNNNTRYGLLIEEFKKLSVLARKKESLFSRLRNWLELEL